MQAAPCKRTLTDKIIGTPDSDKIRFVHQRFLDCAPAVPCFVGMKQYFFDMAGTFPMFCRLEYKVVDIFPVVLVAKPFQSHVC